MPTTVADTRPNWQRPETASVFDSPSTRALRWLSYLTGLDHPTGHVLALMAPMDLRGRLSSALEDVLARMSDKAETLDQAIEAVTGGARGTFQDQLREYAQGKTPAALRPAAKRAGAPRQVSLPGMEPEATAVAGAPPKPAPRVDPKLSQGGLPGFEQEPLDPAPGPRTERGAEQGYTEPVYHHGVTYERSGGYGQPAVYGEPPSTLKGTSGGRTLREGMGIGVTTNPEHYGSSYARPYGEYSMPLQARAKSPLLSPSGQPYTDAELETHLQSIAQRLGYKPADLSYGSRAIPRAQQGVREYLASQGYDSIPYVSGADGTKRWILFDPSQLRSRISAIYDPAKGMSPDLLSGMVPPIIGASALGAASRATDQEQLAAPPPVRR